MLFGLIFALFALIFAVGWIVLLVWGLIRRRQDRTLGTVLAIIGGMWGFAVVAIALVAGYGYRQMSSIITAKQFDPSAYHGKMGKIDLHYKGPGTVRARRTDNSKLWEFTAKNGIAQAPTGDYYVEAVSIASKSSDGRWTATQRWMPAVIKTTSHKDDSCTLPNPSDENPRMRVEVGKKANLDSGMPYVAQVAVASADQGSAVLSLQVTDSRKRPISLGNTGSRDFAAFEVLSDSGKVLWQGSFHPG